MFKLTRKTYRPQFNYSDRRFREVPTKDAKLTIRTNGVVTWRILNHPETESEDE